MASLTPARNPNGEIARNPETMKRDAKAAELRAQRMTYQQIGDELGITRQSAHEAVKRAMNDIVERGRAGTEAAIEMELANLDAVFEGYLEIAQKRHAHLTNKGDVREFEDDTIILNAYNGLIKVSESRRKLLGLNAPTRTEVTGKGGGPIAVTDVRQSLDTFLESLTA